MGRGAYADVSGELTRWNENAIRVAGIIALGESEQTLTEDHARRGIAVVRWCGLEYMRLVGETRFAKLLLDASRLSGLLDANGGEMASGLLQSKHGYKGARWDVVELLVSRFPERFTKERVKKEGEPGAPATIIRLTTPSSKSS